MTESRQAKKDEFNDNAAVIADLMKQIAPTLKATPTNAVQISSVMQGKLIASQLYNIEVQLERIADYLEKVKP